MMVQHKIVLEKKNNHKIPKKKKLLREKKQVQ